jgi:hypothetical protein
MVEKLKKAIMLFCTAVYKNTIFRSVVLFALLIGGAIVNGLVDGLFFAWIAILSGLFLVIQTIVYVIAGVVNIIKDIFR